MAKKENPSTEIPRIIFPDQEAWEQWLKKQQQKAKGIWLQIAKKGSGQNSVTYQDALDSALCFGWIDGQKLPLDETYWLQKFTPRSSKSIWSKKNRDRALALQELGKMTPAGLAEIDRAKADGRWDAAYDSQRTAEIPNDLQEALDKNAKAANFFATLNSVNRYAILFRIQTVKKAETRARKIEQFVAMLAREEKIYP